MMQQIFSSHLKHVGSLWDWPIYNSYDVPRAWKEHEISPPIFQKHTEFWFFFKGMFKKPLFLITDLHLFFFLL